MANHKTVLLLRGIYRPPIGGKEKEKDQGVGKIGTGTIGTKGISRKREKTDLDLVADLVIATPLGAASKPGMSKSSTATMGRGLISSHKAIRATLMTLTQEGMIAS